MRLARWQPGAAFLREFAVLSLLGSVPDMDMLQVLASRFAASTH